MEEDNIVPILPKEPVPSAQPLAPAQHAAVSGPLPEPAKRASIKRPLLIASLVIALVAAIIVAVLLVMPQDNAQPEGQPDVVGGDAELTEIDVNLDIVASTMKPFARDGAYLYGQSYGLYSKDKVTIDNIKTGKMLEVANADRAATTCKMPRSEIYYRYIDWQKSAEKLDFYKSYTNSDWQESFESMYDHGCLDLVPSRAKVKELFDVELELEDGWDGYRYYEYSKDYDELYSIVDGGLGGVEPSWHHSFYKAEIQGDYLYIYETFALSMPDDSLFSIACFEDEKSSTCANSGGHVYFGYVEGESDEAYETRRNDAFQANLDKFDHFKWTFKKAADGRYVFYSLEEIKK